MRKAWPQPRGEDSGVHEWMRLQQECYRQVRDAYFAWMGERIARSMCGCVCEEHCCTRERNCITCLVGRKRRRPFQDPSQCGYYSDDAMRTYDPMC